MCFKKIGPNHALIMPQPCLNLALCLNHAPTLPQPCFPKSCSNHASIDYQITHFTTAGKIWNNTGMRRTP